MPIYDKLCLTAGFIGFNLRWLRSASKWMSFHTVDLLLCENLLPN